MNEPIGKFSEIRVTVHTDERPDTDPSAAVGFVQGGRRGLDGAAFFRADMFDRLWMLATTGMLRRASLTLTKPYRLRARLLHLECSTDPEPDQPTP